MDPAGTPKVSGLQGNRSSTQGALIVPHPVNPKQYYVFTSDGSSGTNHHVNGILVDALSWLWSPIVFSPAAPTAGYSPTEKLTAILHANGRDFWVLTVVQPGTVLGSGTGLGALRVFLVDSLGVHHIIDHPLGQNVEDVGYMKASLGGRRIAIVSYGLAKIIVVPFSNSTGQIPGTMINIPTQPVPFPHNAYFPYGVEFSKSGELLYYTTIYPFNIANTPVTDSLVFQFFLPSGPKLLVGANARAVSTCAGDGCALQFGSDGRIYIAQNAQPKLGVIAHPEVQGPGCNVTFNALSLAAGSTCNPGLPNFIRELF
jgi:hypothetical protein